jgi:molybdopterin-binding protein
MQTLSFQGNTVCGNLVYNLENQTDKNFQVNDICFCTTDSTEIENKIFDGYDDITKGLVNYSIYDDSCDQVLVSVIKVDLGGSTASLTEATLPTLVFDMGSKQLMLTNISGELTLSVYNTMGQRVKQIAVNESNQVITLDLPAGMFLATFDGQPSSESYKFLIP